MLTKLLVAVLVAGGLWAQAPVLGPYSAATNLTFDSAGKPDTRAGTWGSADYVDFPIKFHPPDGYRVRVLRAYGDFIAFPKQGVVPQGTYSEASWGLMTTAPGGSSRVDASADDCFLWRQTLVTSGVPFGHESFNDDVHVGGLLEPDNLMIWRLAVSINTTGLVIHLEPTFVFVYQFELVQ